MGKDLSLVAKGAGFYFAGFAVSKVLSYLYRVMVARGLGPEEFGVFSIGTSIVGILTVFAAFGLYQGIMHFVARHNALGEDEKARGYPYQPEVVLAQPIFQMMIKSMKQRLNLSRSAKKQFDQAFRDGFNAGFRDGYYGNPRKKTRFD